MIRKQFFRAASAALLAATLAGFAQADPLAGQAGAAERYMLWQSGSQTGCMLALTPLDGGRMAVTPEGECDGLGDYLADAVGAVREEDGTVVISDGSGQALLVLAPGDGFDYEAVQPQSAMLALASAD